jgi:hypothetical protein
MICHSSGHGRSDSQSLVNPAQIVVSIVKGNRGNVIFEFLRDSIGEPGEPAHSHSHGETLG